MEKEKLNKELDEFLVNDDSQCEKDENDVCVIPSRDGLIERKKIQKKLIIEDGRELLI